LGAACRIAVHTGQAVFIPPTVFHQLTNTGPTPMRINLFQRGQARKEKAEPFMKEVSAVSPRSEVIIPVHLKPIIIPNGSAKP
jgi:phosphopantothenate synthetase